MGNSISRPSCLGDKSRKSEEFLKDCYRKKDLIIDSGNQIGKNNSEPKNAPPDKSPNPVVIENGWNVTPGSVKSQQPCPLPKQNNTELELQNGTVNCGTLKVKLDPAIAALTPQRGSLQRHSGSSWSWKPYATREVTEVTEVTETVVTEIVEVTEYPSGDKGGEPIITRTVKVLTECAGELSEIQKSRDQQTDDYCLDQWSNFNKKVAQRAISMPEDTWAADENQETMEALLSWLADMEELVANQKPPSSEVKVVKAQLQEQKLLQRLLEDRRPRVQRALQDKRPLAEMGIKTDGTSVSAGMSDLQERWEGLVQKAEARHSHLEDILPAAQAFQEHVDGLQDWLLATERRLAELWRANGGVEEMEEGHQQILILGEDIRSKPVELEGVLENGNKLLELIEGEEAQLTQEKMESMRVRYLIIVRSSGDILHRLEAALEASSQVDPSQEDLNLWLGRMEKELATLSGCDGDKTNALSAADQDKFEQVVESELAQLSRTEVRLEELCHIQLDSENIQCRLSDHKILAVEILQHQSVIDRLLALSKPLLVLCPAATQRSLQPCLDSLAERAPQVLMKSSSSAMQLEHLQSLLAQYSETQEELLPWLEDTQAEIAQLSPCSFSSESFKEQQELLQQLREAIAEHKPLVTKLQRVSCKLAEFNATDGARFQLESKAIEEQYGGIREAVRLAASILEDAVPRYSQVTERMDLMAECLERLQDRLENAPSIRGESARIREQIKDNALLLGELERLRAALETIQKQGAELLGSSQMAGAEATAKGVQDRIQKLQDQWNQLQNQADKKETWLQSLLALADRFWHGLSDLTVTLGDTQQMVLEMDESGAEADSMRLRLNAMQVLREEIDSLQHDLDTLGLLGVELMSLCGDMDKPDVTKSMDDLYSSWGILNKVWVEQSNKLEEQLQDTLSYQEAMQRLFEWLDMAESRISEEFLIGGDLDMVRRQLAELKEFKRDLYQHKVELESLRHQVGSSGTEQRGAGSQLDNFRRRWQQLEEEVVDRQHQLEMALLGLGQFQNQLEELLQWLSHTAEQLQGQGPVGVDLQSCEIELAKHKVLRNDVMSHARTLESVNEVGQGLLQSSLGDNAETLQSSLLQLNQRWEFLHSETERRQMELENNLGQVQDVTLDFTDLVQWLENVEIRLSVSKPAWSHPETTKEKLSAHLELCKEMESKQPAYNGVRDRLQRLLATGPTPRSSNTEHSLRILEQKWETVHSKIQDRKVRLTEGLTVTTEFHSTVQDLLKWIARTEESFGSLPPPSFVLETVTNQIQEHKVLVKEVATHGEKLVGLETVACRLKDFSRKQDCAVIQNLMLTAQERLGKVQHRIRDRTRALEESRKRAKQFSESRLLLLDWMEEVDQTLETDAEAATNTEDIKRQLADHKAFQKVLRSKRPVYEATVKNGRSLREKNQLSEDGPKLEELLGSLKEKWDSINGRSVERQHKLEEALLFSGKFTDALQALMDWLYGAEPQLSEEMLVGGDRDMVNDLLDKHKVFQKELGKRASCIKTLKRSVRDLTRGSISADSQWLQKQMEELNHRWELVCKLSVSKQARLEASLSQAEEFHNLVHSFLERLTESERTLKYGVIPEEEAALQECQKQQQELMKTMQCQQLALECILSLGEEILSGCHPDSIITIKSWINVSSSRYQEVLTWAQQQGERIQSHSLSLATEREEIARLLDWITAAEESLSLRDQEPLPEKMEPLEELVSQHTVFVAELERKQPEVEKVTKNCKKKVGSEPRTPVARKVSSKRRSSLKSPQPSPTAPLVDLEPQTPQMAQLLNRWQQLWFLSMDRQCRLQAAQQRLREVEEFSKFDFAVWRKRYMQWISHMKSRILDIFRGIDRDQDGRISQMEFVDSVLTSKFPTNALEMTAVANIFDINGDGFIDYYEFVSALHPSRDPFRKTADADQIQDEVNRQVAQCNCAKQFQVEQISANRYRFGESQQLRMVRILRSTLMVRVGGGWIALDEFLVKNDPCRVKGRTNLKINEKYLSPDSFAASPLRCGGNPSKMLSPSRSNSSLSLYSSASAPSSPLPRKSVLRRTRSGDRCHRSRNSLITDGAELKFTAADDSKTKASSKKTEGLPT
ncbi:microtubule-actin cross-linking factor 1, isoforms 6/7-like [Ambystoma mexicanum]|uniref:microtubule-actin cross-linking factor 1, isoforms 6/7-like n=1 Tax=Ambystoma mexicanum TaxID=8296 RepID=UPI0037E7EC31